MKHLVAFYDAIYGWAVMRHVRLYAQRDRRAEQAPTGRRRPGQRGTGRREPFGSGS